MPIADFSGNSQRSLTTVYLCTAVYWAALVFVMHVPLNDDPLTVETSKSYDKLVHITAYGLFAVLMAHMLDARARCKPTGKSVHMTLRHFLVFVLVALYGIVDEWTQPLTGRTWDLLDLTADVVGAAVGLLIYRGICRRRERRVA